MIIEVNACDDATVSCKDLFFRPENTNIRNLMEGGGGCLSHGGNYLNYFKIKLHFYS